MAKRPTPTSDGFHASAVVAGAPSEHGSGSGSPGERISLDEILAIFRPDSPPMAAVTLVWDNPENLDLPAMRLRLRKIARDLKAQPLQDAIDDMMIAVDEALLQLETAPTGLTLPQARALKDAAVHLRQILTGIRTGA